MSWWTRFWHGEIERNEPPITDPMIIELRKHLAHQEMLRKNPHTAWCCRCMAKTERGEVGPQARGKVLYAHVPATHVDKFGCPYCDDCFRITQAEFAQAMARGNKRPQVNGPVIDITPENKLTRRRS